MARRRYQQGSLTTRGKRLKVWVARWWEEVIQPDGSPGRMRRSEVLGPVTELSKRDAHKLLEARLRPLNQGRHRPQSAMTLRQFVQQRWLPATSAQHRGSMQTYLSKLRRHVLPALGEKRLLDLARWDVQRFLTEKLGHGYSGAHVHGMRTALSKVLQAAVEWGYLEDNPVRGCQVGNREPVRETRYLDPAQVRLLTADLPEPCRTLVLLAVLTGMRIGELLALRWRRIDLFSGTLSVVETFSDGRFGPPKTRSSRRAIPLSSAARQVLLEHRARCTGVGPEDLVFACRNGTPVNPKNLLRRALRPACVRVELPLVTWHSFRHTHATWLSGVGAAPRTAQAILGHSNVEVTLGVYTHVTPADQRDAMEKVGAVLDPNGPKLDATEQNRPMLVQ